MAGTEHGKMARANGLPLTYSCELLDTGTSKGNYDGELTDQIFICLFPNTKELRIIPPSYGTSRFIRTVVNLVNRQVKPGHMQAIVARCIDSASADSG